MGLTESVALKENDLNISSKKSFIGSTKILYNGKSSNLKEFFKIHHEQAEIIKRLERENEELRNKISNNKRYLENSSLDILHSDNPSHLQIANSSSSIDNSSIMPINQGVVPEKRIAISAEPFKGSTPSHYEKYSKSEKIRELIKNSFQKNELLCFIETNLINEIIERMIPCTFPPEHFIIKEKENGDILYVIEEGTVCVIKNDNVLNIDPLGPETVFGELALLYNCQRTASIKSITSVKGWYINRKDFQMIMKSNLSNKRNEKFNFLKRISVFKELDDTNILRIVDSIVEKTYEKDIWILKENDVGETFYLIISGEVKVYKLDVEEQVQVEIRTLIEGDYFGEKALLAENCIRTASIKTVTEVKCYEVYRDAFINLVGSLAKKEYNDETIRAKTSLDLISSDRESWQYGSKKFLTKYDLEELEAVATLGRGGFGQVDLVICKDDPSLMFALKRMSKKFIVDTKQEEHVYNEKNILVSCNCNFIAKLYQTHRDSSCIYLLLEACLGGEIFSMLHSMGKFDVKVARFFIACVVEALEYIHSRKIIYRDLKPENLVMDLKGYIKLVDFGFAKKLRNGEKTWTFCGTPEYVAPEIITSKGHDRSADYWSLGVLVYELVCGGPPFRGDGDALSTYKQILKGLDSVTFHKTMPKSAQDLMRKLCKDNPTSRLGYQKNGISDIKKHKFFDGIDWNSLQSLTYMAPYTPKQFDLDSYKTNASSKLIEPKNYSVEVSGWDQDF